MDPDVRQQLQKLTHGCAVLLERLQIIERSRLKATFELAWPRIVTGLARISQQTADIAFVGLVLGPAAIAGLAFAYAYWQVANRLSLGLSGGSISLVSQHYGGDNTDFANRAIAQSYVLATLLAIPFVVVYAGYAESLIRLMGSEAAAVDYGARYLTVLAPAAFFEFYNKIASRIFSGFTWTRATRRLLIGQVR